MNTAHEHVNWTSASMVSAMMCSLCGALVGSEGRTPHQEFHDRVALLEARAGTGEHHESHEAEQLSLLDL
jgi:hypothetical protein